MSPNDITPIIKLVTQAFDKFNIAYYIGGSVASSIYGMARVTMDVDLVADIKSYHVPQLVECLKNKFYIDDQMIIDAIEHVSSFNLIHLTTSTKVDVFIFDDSFFDRNALERRKQDKLDDQDDEAYYFSSPEDTILAKLRWYDQGNRVSERQWLDIIGVIKVQADVLDKEYLITTATRLKLTDLLFKAFEECNIEIMR